MIANKILNTGKTLLISSLFAFAMLSVQGCYSKTEQVKSSCQSKKCGGDMKCQSGKCGTAKEATPAKCASGKCGEGK